MGVVIKPGVIFISVRMENNMFPTFIIEVGGYTFNVKPDRVQLCEFILKIVEPAVRQQIEKLTLALPSAASPEPTSRRIKRSDDDDEPQSFYEDVPTRDGEDFDDD